MIKELTKEQENKLVLYREEYIKKGLSTERVDETRAVAAVKVLYECAGLRPPKEILFVASPLAGVKLVTERSGNKLTKENVNEQINIAGYGGHDAGWVSFYAFFNDVCALKNTDAIKGQIEAVNELGWYWPFEDLCVVSDRPTILKQENGRGHCETGAAIAYKDGFEVFLWRGVRVPKNWIMNKASLTPEIALKVVNMDERKAACEIVGWNNILKKLNGKTIQKDLDPQIGELIEVDMPDIGKARFLRVTCGTGRNFAIPVPPDISTALAANAWTYALEKEVFKPEIRT